MRAITCLTCGKIKPTPPDDAARNLFNRYQRGKVLYKMACDYCGQLLAIGDEAMAITCPADLMPGWESGYLNMEPKP